MPDTYDGVQTLPDGRQVPGTVPAVAIVTTHWPGKWLFLDMQNGNLYAGGVWPRVGKPTVEDLALLRRALERVEREFSDAAEDQ